MTSEKRPHQGPPSETSRAATPTSIVTELIINRRASASRLAPLANGSVDPWAEQARQPLPIRDDLESRRAVWRHFYERGLATNDPDDFISAILMRGAA